MSYEQKRKDIQSHFNTNFTGVASDKIAWDNVKFDIPTDDTAWVRISVQHNTSNYVSFGPSRLTRREGIVFVQIFVPEGSTTLEASQIVDNAVAVFETKLLSGVVFQSGDVREVGVSEGWFQINISVPFYFNDVTTYS
jgi:hypothetical protein